MKNKGFTLLELLAIIIILAVIALITVPVIFNVMESAKKSAVKESVNFYIDTIQKNAVANSMIQSSKSFNNTSCVLLNEIMNCSNNELIEMKMNGDKLDELNVEFGNNGIIETASFKKDNYCGIYKNHEGIKFNTCGAKEIVDAKDVSFTPSNSNWNVTNVEEALNNLYNIYN